MVILKLIAIISFFIYSFSLVFFLLGLFRFKRDTLKTKINNLSTTVVVAARNEEKNLDKLIKSLINQTVDTEIIIVNDRSTDGTERILKKYPEIKYFNIKEIAKGISPKKNALRKGISEATGDVIFLTDADCIPSHSWIETMIGYFKNYTGVVSGLSYLNEKNILHKIMNLEYFALSICTAGAIGWNFPVISTGNNLAYRKKAFKEAKGFDDILYIDSGDDDLMVQKISKNTDWKFSFAFNSKSFVETEPVSNLKEFVNQRRRWASRGLDYNLSIKIPLILIYLFYLLILFLPIYIILIPSFFGLLLKLFLISAGMEVLLLGVGLFRIKKMKYLLLYPVAKILHIPYIAIMPALGILRGFKWK
ncbi:MAG: glycosyltransferase [Candidatus Mcinerneyibacterium aminivorans]|uniref:Glycosyltransferase n=1 Tax=Candidatus Mcinerneyibacterium aminivorans TaxID=2703815 RepID=A0A5D0MK69_9BACT|nr:MAG: glycosyltransferase [Candidatus Mcinerneyibacterium aminivorans]